MMFAESDLMGTPHRIVIGERGLADEAVEYKSRQQTDAQNVSLSEIKQHILTQLN